MTKSVPRSRREIKSFSEADSVRLVVPLPAPGHTVEIEYPRYGLSLIVERREEDSQEQLRARFVLTAPMEKDRRTHATRIGTGLLRPKKMGVTLCTEEVAQSLGSGPRIDGLTLEHVTCSKCRSKLASEGVELVDQEGSGS